MSAHDILLSLTIAALFVLWAAITAAVLLWLVDTLATRFGRRS